MGRIDWGRRSGEEVETVVGIMLARRFKTVERITPSQGDGGLDVIWRDGDEWTIWQVKKYDAQPTTPQRAKIKRSLERAADFAEKNSIPIKSWSLVAPVSPTPQSLTWFVNLTKSYSFTCIWLGSDFLDGLAAEFPEVIDYYFADGKDRLTSALAGVAESVGLGVRSKGDLQPGDIVSSLTSAHELANKLDPHFQYDFSVDTLPPELVAVPGLVFASTTGNDDRCVTVRVFEKYDGALKDRPITGKGELNTPDDVSREAVRDFFEYGCPLELPDGSATMEADLPGGLDGSLRSGAIYITPIPTPLEEWSVIRYRISDDTRPDIATIKLRVPPATRGVTGLNRRAVAQELAGNVFSVEQRYTDATESMRLSFALNNLTDAIPENILPGLRFLDELRAGRFVQFGRELGPIDGIRHPVERDMNHLVSGGLLSLIEALVELQEVTEQQLRVPDLSKLTDQAGTAIIRAARLLRGDEVSVHVPQIRALSNGTSWPDGNNAVMLVLDYKVPVGELTVDIGPVAFNAPAAAVTSETETDGNVYLYIRPLPGENVLRGSLRAAESE